MDMTISMVSVREALSCTYVRTLTSDLPSLLRAHSPDRYQVENRQQQAESTTLQRFRPYALAGNAVRV